MSFINSVSPNGTISGPLPNSAPPPPTTPTSSVTGTAPVARSLLPSAVVGSNIVPSYTQEPRVTKTPLRAFTSPPSSTLAAQLLGQTPEPSDDELAIFEPRDSSAYVQQYGGQSQDNAAPQDDFLANLRAARGDVPVAANNNTPPAQTAAATGQVTAAASNVLAFTTQTSAIAAGAKPLPALATTPSSVPISGPVRNKPGIALSRGSAAYALTAARSEVKVISAGIDAIS